MSPYNKEQFNVWFPALVCGLLIGLIAAAGWDILRRRFWGCVSRFWPGVLGEVGLDNLTRVEVEKKDRLMFDMLSEVHRKVTKSRESLSLGMTKAIDSTAVESSNSSNSSVSSNDDFDLEGQKPDIHCFSTPTGTFPAIAYFAEGTPTFVIRPVMRLFKRHGNGTVKRWKSSIVLQASLPIEACVVAEFEELARISILEENKCTFQLGNWAILYYKAGEVCLHEMKEGDVPVNVEARWQNKMTGIKMRGLYLNGAQVKVATEHASNILRSVGPATKGHGDLDELNFNIEDLDVPRGDAVIFAAKLIDGDGISVVVRSEASFIRPKWAGFTVTEAFWSQLQWISQFAKMMMKLLVSDEDRQPEAAETLPNLILDQEQCQHIVQHWKGVLEIEILEKRKEVLHYLQELREFGESYSTMSHLSIIRDRHPVGYWERVLQELDKIILQHEGSQSGTYIRIRGGVRFLLGNYEDALYDLDRAHLITQDDHRTTLYERALVKCMIARYSEALEDVCSVISMNPNFSDIQELKTCIQHILEQQTPLPTVQDDSSRLLEQARSMVEMHILEQQTPLPTIQDGLSRLLEQARSMVEMHILEQQTPLLTVQDDSSSLLEQPQSMVEMHILEQQTPLLTVQDDSSSLLEQPQSMVEMHILEQQTPLLTVQDDSSSLLEQPQSMVEMHILEQQTPLLTVQDDSSSLLEQPQSMVEMHILEQQTPLPTVQDDSSSLLEQRQSMVEIDYHEKHSLDQRTPVQSVQDGSSSLPVQPQSVVGIPDLLSGDEWHSQGKKKDGNNKEDGGSEKDGDYEQLKVIELRSSLCCESCVRKLRRKLEKLDGVDCVIYDVEERKVTVEATLDTNPETVLKQARKVKKDTVLWPEGENEGKSERKARSRRPRGNATESERKARRPEKVILDEPVYTHDEGSPVYTYEYKLKNYRGFASGLDPVVYGF